MYSLVMLVVNTGLGGDDGVVVDVVGSGARIRVAVDEFVEVLRD